jgi:hypothetical protein
MTQESFDFQSQIPLYINGALGGEKRDAFEQALKQDTGLKQQYKEFYEIDSVFETIEDVSAQTFEKLFHQVQVGMHAATEQTAQPTQAVASREPSSTATSDEASTEQSRSHSHDEEQYTNEHDIALDEESQSTGSLKEALLDILSSPRVSWGVVAAQFVILIALLFLPAGDNGTHGPGLGAGKSINVVFADNATQKQIRELLVSIEAQISNGPTSVGLYTIHVPGDEEHANAIIDKLKKSALILLAEPAFI